MIRTKKRQIKKCQKIADHYGPKSQESQTVSELMELGHVLTRRPSQRHPGWKEDLLDEAVDVTIMIQQLRLLYEITDEEFNKTINEKLDRQLQRIKDGDHA